MKKLLLLGVVGLALLTGCDSKKGAFLETVDTPNNISTAIDKLKTALPEKGLKLMGSIDHAKQAKDAGIRLNPEIVIMFGNPQIGAKLMQCNPSMGIDLPLRMLFSASYDGQTTITYTNPEYWSLKHNIKDKTCLAILQQATRAMRELAQEAGKK